MDELLIPLPKGQVIDEMLNPVVETVKGVAEMGKAEVEKGKVEIEKVKTAVLYWVMVDLSSPSVIPVPFENYLGFDTMRS